MKTTDKSTLPSRAVVVGLGVSGRSVCELLLREGSQVVATDLRPREQFAGALDSLEERGCELRLGSHLTEDFLRADQVIVSPGVPLDIEPLKEAAARGIEIVGELEWAWRQVSVPVVAVTGTNGKTTTTSLIGEMFKAAGRKTFVGGNIGTPLSRWVLSGESADVLVLEVSSFQLDTASQFQPEVGILLNITEDHLDRYANFGSYADSKLSIFARQTSEQFAVVNGDDPICRRRSGEIAGRVLFCSRKDELAAATVKGRNVVVNIPDTATFSLDLSRSLLKGVHNEENILASALAAAVMNVPPSAMQRVIDAYRGLPHRVEWVDAVSGLDFYDDSKGTNVGAVVKALENFDRPVLLLLGGRDKLGSYQPLAEALRGRGKAVMAFGEAGPRIYEQLAPHIDASCFENLEQAFGAAVEMAARGDIVLLSPACSSFDQYESYAHRGDHFKRLVAQLKVKEGSTRIMKH